MYVYICRDEKKGEKRENIRGGLISLSQTQSGTMAAKKRAKEQRPDSNLIEAKVESVSVSESKPEARPLAPPKISFIATISLFVLAPYFSLIFFHHNIPAEYKNSIAVNAILSFIAFLATLYLIPMLPKPLLRRGIFGKDINKKGTSLGSVPM